MEVSGKSVRRPIAWLFWQKIRGFFSPKIISSSYTSQPLSKTNIWRLNRTERCRLTKINKTHPADGPSEQPTWEQPTWQLNNTDAERAETQAPECEKGKYSGTTSRKILTGGEAASPKVTHTYYTHRHRISFPTSWFLSHHRTSRWQRGGAEISSHVYHLSTNAPDFYFATS